MGWSERFKFLHHLLHDEEGKELNEKGQHIAHLVNGKYHIGYGHLLEGEQQDKELEIMGLEDELDDWKGFTINEEQAQALFGVDVEDAQEAAGLSFTREELTEMSSERWAVIISMCFQMGSVTKFKSFIAAVKAGDWGRAADEMLWSNGLKKQRRSAWYKETPRRCEKASEIMRGEAPIQSQPDPTALTDSEISEIAVQVMRKLPALIEEVIGQQQNGS